MLAPQPFFLGRGADALFVVHFPVPAHVPARAPVLFVPPFAEEMNKSRRLMAETARALASAGRACLLVDLYGTGDSAGDFGEASWTRWIDDLEAAARWLEGSGREAPAIVAVRAGALLMADWLKASGRACSLHVLWQPAPNGRQFLSQFLRLRVMARRFAGVEESTGALLARLAEGDPVEVAGYALAPEVAGGLGSASLIGWTPAPGSTVEWLEIGPEPRPEPGPAQQAVLAAWQGEGRQVRYRPVAGEAFWNVQEIAAPTAAVAATLAAMGEGSD